METENKKLEANLSALIMSIGSNALMSMGHTPNAMTGKTEVAPKMAQFNIDLLMVLKEKTKGHLSEQENELLSSLIKDLQIKFVERGL